MTRRRDPERERVFLQKAAGLAPPFRDAARQRLAYGQARYGDSWARREVADLLFEIARECVDVAAWAALADQALENRGNRSDQEHQLLASAVLHAARCGALGYVGIAKAGRLVPEIERNVHGE